MKKKVTKANLIISINEIMTNEKYNQNCERLSKIVQEHDGKKTFYYWLNFIVEIGYEHLLISAVLEENWIKLNNADVGFVWFIIFLCLGWILKKILGKLFSKKKN